LLQKTKIRSILYINSTTTQNIQDHLQMQIGRDVKDTLFLLESKPKQKLVY